METLEVGYWNELGITPIICYIKWFPLEIIWVIGIPLRLWGTNESCQVGDIGWWCRLDLYIHPWNRLIYFGWKCTIWTYKTQNKKNLVVPWARKSRGGVFTHSRVSMWLSRMSFGVEWLSFGECTSFVQLNVVLMCKLFLPSKAVKTSWISWNPVGKLETVPSQRSCLACEEIQGLFNTICGFSGAYKLLSVVVG